jgi:opacity protein-like surface antigen
MQKQTLAALLLLCAASSGIAVADTYLTVGGYYSKVEKPVDRSGGGGQIGIGYALTEQWSLEVGYDQLINKDPQWPTNGYNNSLVFESGHKSAGLSLSVLGKTALDDSNTLFYRIGAINNKSESWVFHRGNKECAAAESPTHTTLFSINSVVIDTVRGCTSSNTNIGLIYGLGIDHQFNQQWFSRVEVVGLSDPDTESMYALKLAVGYRF